MKRLYDALVAYHIAHYEQMMLLSGPRQVGKTTIARAAHHLSPYFRYLNWDKLNDRELILAGDEASLAGLPLRTLSADKPIIVFDEIHQYRYWRAFLKGLIDTYKGELHVLVTGSAKLNIVRRGGDSLMGRYFPYRIHPFSVAECVRTELSTHTLSPPRKMDDDQFQALFEFGGFPEPFIKQDRQFYNQWQNLRQEQMIREDIRELSHIQALAQLEVLANLLKHQAGGLVDYASLAKKIRVSDQTIRRWVHVLESFYQIKREKPRHL